MTYMFNLIQMVSLMVFLAIKTDFLWQLVMIFGGLAVFCFLLIFYFRNRLVSKGRQVSSRKSELGPMIRNYLLEQTDTSSENEADLLWMKMEIRQLLKNPTDRNVITEIMLEVQREAMPETRLRISGLYQYFELHDYPLSQLESRKWEQISRGISELSEMQVTHAYDAIKEHINSKNSIVRKQAQLATVRLKEEGIQYFLDTARFPISQWQQVKIMEILAAKSGFTPPGFRNWLISENQDVVLFALRLIRVFKQVEANQALLMFLHHKSERIQIAALECIADFRYKAAHKSLIACFKNASAEIKIHILNTLESIGDSQDIPWLQEQAVNEDSFLVRSKAGLVINALQPESVRPDIGLQGELELWTAQAVEDDPEIFTEKSLSEIPDSDGSLDLFSSEPLLIDTLRPDFATSPLTTHPGVLNIRKDKFIEEFLSETPKDIPLEAWTDEHESVFEECILQELMDILTPESGQNYPGESSEGFLPLIVDQIQNPSNMTPGKLTPHWIRELEVEIESLSGSSGYLGILREILLQELRETEDVLETEFIPGSGGGDTPPEFEGFEETDSPGDLLPEFGVDPDDIHQGREEITSEMKNSKGGTDAGCFSIFEEFFRSYDTEAKLILMDEIHLVGGMREFRFLQALFADPDPRIRKHARKAHALLAKRLKVDSETLTNVEPDVFWTPAQRSPEVEKAKESESDSDNEYFDFSPDPDCSFPNKKGEIEDVHHESEEGYYRPFKQIKKTKNDSDV